jgi:hypothetical protein
MRFEDECNRRRDAVVEKLKVIRTLQEAHKMVYNCYAADLDSLVINLQQGKQPVVKKEVLKKVPEDMTESEALKQGYIRRDTVFMNPIEKLREEKKLDPSMTNEKLFELKYVPVKQQEGKERLQFTSDAGFIERGGFNVPVFEVKVDLKDLLWDLDEQDVINKIAGIERVSNKYAGWKVGDMDNPVTDGNFE